MTQSQAANLQSVKLPRALSYFTICEEITGPAIEIAPKGRPADRPPAWTREVIPSTQVDGRPKVHAYPHPKGTRCRDLRTLKITSGIGHAGGLRICSRELMNFDN